MPTRILQNCTPFLTFDIIRERFDVYGATKQKNASSVLPGCCWCKTKKEIPDTAQKPAPKTVRVWWGKVDSNHRSDKQQIYSLSPLATREFPHIQLTSARLAGAGRRTRTPDLLITNQLLYQLSYTGNSRGTGIL